MTLINIEQLKQLTGWSDVYIWKLARRNILTVTKCVNNGNTINLYDREQALNVLAEQNSYITLSQFARIACVSRTCLNRIMKSPAFPKQVIDGIFYNTNKNIKYFKLHEVEDFLKKHHPYKVDKV
jgi:predicted DNA-binding transcriptional regulator AlpA